MNYDGWTYECEFLRKYEKYAIARYNKVVNRVFGTLIAIFSVLYMFVACPAPLEVMMVALVKGTVVGLTAGTAVLVILIIAYAWYRWAFDKGLI